MMAVNMGPEAESLWGSREMAGDIVVSLWVLAVWENYRENVMLPIE